MNNSNKKYIKVPLVEYAGMSTTDKNAFIFYITLLIKYNNNIINNATLNKLSKLTTVSKNTIIKYKRILIEWDYIKVENKTLTIIPIKVDIHTKKYLLHIYRSLNFEKVKELIEVKLIKIHVDQQEFRELCKHVAGFKSKSKKIKKLLIKQKDSIIGGKIFISSRSLGKVLGISAQKMNNRLNSAKKHSLINYKEEYKIFKIKKIKMNNVNRSFYLYLIKNMSELFNEYYKLKYYNNSIYVHTGILISYYNNVLV
jgi:hypothetical protein